MSVCNITILTSNKLLRIKGIKKIYKVMSYKIEIVMCQSASIIRREHVHKTPERREIVFWQQQ